MQSKFVPFISGIFVGILIVITLIDRPKTKQSLSEPEIHSTPNIMDENGAKLIGTRSTVQEPGWPLKELLDWQRSLK